MFKKRAVYKNETPGLPGPAGERFSFLNRPTILAFLAFTILGLLFSLLIYQRYELLKETKRKEALDIANNVKDKLQETLEHSLSAAKVLSFFIDKEGEVKNFDSIASEIFNAGSDIDALQLVPGGVIKYVYPVKGNEAVIGYNILKDSLRNIEAYKAIEKKQMFFAGPFELKQGGMGVVGRLPVFRNNKFWGFSAVVIKMPTLFKAAGINGTSNKGYYFLLSKINPGTKKEEFFLSEHKKQYKNLSVSLNVPNGEWKLYVIRKSEYQGFGDIILLTLLGSLLSVLGAVFIFSVAIRPKKLDELVKERTRKLKESENKYRSLIERVSDAFVSLDNNWNYTYLNKKAGELFDKDPEKLVGKNIWIEFPQGIDQPYYHAYRRAMESQMYQYTEEYYSLPDKWFENHIYPSEDGLTIFFTDVTDIKKVTLALKENEEKYRSLIEQASDGIVITDLDGYIQEVNNSICMMSGYSAEETLGMHLYKFLPVEDTALNPFKFKELLEGKSLLYEGRLLRKDGTIVEIEVNSRMASTHTLIGFIRDITERRKNEETLRYQARLLEVVSDAVTSLDMNRCIVSWNHACEELYGFTREEVMGKKIPELVTFEFPGTTSEEVFKQVFGEGLWKGEFNFIHPKTGIKTHLLSSINMLKGKQGNIAGFIITSKDITDRKKAEEEISKSNERFELIAQATNDTVWDHDFNKNETWGNKRLYNLYGFDSEAKKINFEIFLEQIHPEDRERIVENLKSALDRNDDSLSEEFRFKTANGEYRNFYDRAYIKYDSEGKVLRMLGSMQDITERKKAEEDLVEKEKKIQQVLSSTADNFYVIDPDYNVILINKVAERNLAIAWGRSVKQGTNLLDVIPRNGEEPIKENFDKAFAGENIEYEMYHTNPDLPAWVMVRITPVINESGIIIAVSVIAEDISERKKVEVLIRESEERYRVLVENAPEALVVLDGETQQFLSVSESASLLFKMSKEELLKLGPVSVSPQYQPDGRLSSEAATEKIKKAINGEKPVFEWTHCDKAGNLISCEVWLVRLPSENKILIRGSVMDITDRKKAEVLIRESEAKYRIMIEQASDGIFIANSDSYFIDVNSAGCRMLGYTKEELYKLKFTSLIPLEDIEGNNPVQFSKLESGDTVINERRLIKKDGSLIDVEISAKVLFDGRYQSIVRDITERKKTFKALQESEERYRALVENAPEALVVFDVGQEKFLSVSQSAIKLFGMTEEELLKLGPVAISPEYQPDGSLSSDAVIKNIQKAIQGEKPAFEWVHCDKAGNLIPCEVRLVRLPSETKILIRGSIIDISERKKAAEEIVNSKKQFQNLVENISGVYWVNNLETYETLYISPSYETIWGSTCEDLYKNPADFINAIHPEDKNLIFEAHKNIASTYKNNLLYRIIRPDGEIRWISANTNVVIDADGKKIEYGYAEDITERRQAEEELLQSEQKYRLLFYNNPLPMWMTTIPGLDIIDVNESAIKQYGYNREEFLKLNARDLRPAEDVEHFVNEVKKMKPDINNTRAWRHKKKDGTIIHVEIYSHEILYEGKRVWLGLSHDVTEKYNARELLQESYEEIRQLASNLQSIREDERTNIAREIHDELGQQLTGLKMDMHWLTRKIKSTDKEVNEKMKESIQLINATIASVRKIATDLRPSILDDLGLLAALEWQSEEFEKRSGTKVKFINRAGDITVLPEVATALFRIYQELLTNIARHANAGLVTASLYIVDKDLCFSIADNGVGFNLDTINKKKTLGILGIKERTLLIGGSYEIKTRPGEGSETIISIPLYLVKNTD